MGYLFSVIYILNSLAVAAMLLLFMAMGKRLGEALELPRYHRLYVFGALFLLLPLLIMCILLLVKAWGLPNPDAATSMIIKVTAVSLPLAIGITLAVYATAKYWGWIWDELRQTSKESGVKDEV
jgi:predicted permease